MANESVVQMPVVVTKDGKSVVYEAGSENAPKAAVKAQEKAAEKAKADQSS